MDRNNRKRVIAGICMMCMLCLLTGCGKKKDSVSGDSVSGEAAPRTTARTEGVWTQESDTVSGSAANAAGQGAASQNTASYSKDASGVDYTLGTVVVDFTNAKSTMDQAALAKQAMAGQAYFSGKAVTVNDILNGYGQGEWSAIVSPQNEICVWYTGIRDQSEFKVNFVVYSDGTFSLKSITVDDERVDDYEDYMSQVICRQ